MEKGRRSCIKCGKRVNVLVCKNSRCPITIHKSCMTSPARFDDAGNFNCPYCLYKQSVEECSRAKNNVLLAKRALSIFLERTTLENKDHKPKAQKARRIVNVSKTVQKQEEDGGRERKEAQKGDQHVRIENDEKADKHNLECVRRKSFDEEPASLVIDGLKNVLTNFTKVSGNAAQRGNGIKSMVSNHKLFDNRNCGNMCLDVGDKPRCTITKRGTSERDASLGAVGGEKILSNHCLQDDGSRYVIVAGEKQLPETVYNGYLEKETGGKEASLSFDSLQRNQEIKQVIDERRDLAEMVNKQHGGEPYETNACSMSKGGRDKVNKTPRSDGDVAGISRHNQREVLCEYAKQSIRGAMKSKNVNPPVRISFEPNENEQYECKDNNIADPGESKGPEMPVKRSHTEAFFNAKRKKVRWTPEEEEMLKEAVLIFSSTTRKNLSWRKILEFGQHVFDGTRTPSDLRDKWKVILKRGHDKSCQEQ